MGRIERLVLTDDRNRSIGWGEKLHVHEAGLLHRAFSIFLVDREGSIALQKRHPAKYHSGGLWANTCCGHPRPGEATMRAARRRLFEEVGVAADLTLAFRSRYAVAFENGLSENEIVSVYVGSLTGTPRPHPEEVVANFADSYAPAGRGRYSHVASGLAAQGSSSLLVSAEDMGKWLLNFESARVGGKSAIELMQQPGKLNSGSRVDYGFGIGLGQYHGSSTITHGGGWAGYRSFVLWIPEKRFGVAVLGTIGSDGIPGLFEAILLVACGAFGGAMFGAIVGSTGIFAAKRH